MMLAQWMAYSLLTGALVSAAAWAVETWFRASGRAVRWVWVVAPLLTLFLPVLALVTGGRYPGGVFRALPAGLPADLVEVLPGAGAMVVEPGLVERLSSLALSDGVLAAAWLVATLAAALWYAGVWRRLASSSRTWRRAVVAGRDVLVARDGGPAAVGLTRPSIVVPEWLLRASEDTQRVVLMHEAEHVRSRDHALLALAPLPVILFPWNLALWWQRRRLRLAVELDCDRRVLARGVDVERYASLLLEIAVRPRGHALAAPLARPERRPLETRLLAMTREPLPWRRLRAFASIAAAAVFLAVACETDPPVAPAASSAGDEASARATPAHPPSAVVRASEGSATMAKLVDEVESGRVEVFIDGKRAVLEAVRELEAGDIASIEVRKGSRLAIAPGDDWAHVEGRIWIRTKVAGAPAPIREEDAARRQADGIELRPVLEGASAEAAIFIDGREATQAELAALPTSDIARVEVVKRKDGDGVAASQIRIFTKAGGGD